MGRSEEKARARGPAPLLRKVPPKRRTLLFAPVALVLAFLGWFFVGLATGSFLAALFVGVPLGVAGAWLLLGLPEIPRIEGEPLVDPRMRPWLSVPAAAVATLALYFVLGLLVTAATFVPIQWASWITLALSFAGGIATGLFLFGPPPVLRAPREAWARVPTERRPWLFFPLALVLSALVYYALGRALTVYGTDDLPQALIALPLAIVSGCTLAFLLVGFPRPRRRIRQSMPPIPPRARPVLFAATIVALGPLFAFALGPFVSDLPLEGVFDLYVGLLVGYVLATVAAALAWGLPRRWSRAGDWKPDLPPNLRLAFFAPVGLAVGAFVLVALNVAGLDFAPALLVAAGLGVLSGLWASGALRRVRRAPEAVRDLPEVVKPLVFFSVWFVAGGLVYLAVVAVFFAHPTWAVLAGALGGLAAAVLVVEAPLLAEVRAERQRLRREAAEMRRERKARLAEVPGKAPAAPRSIVPDPPAKTPDAPRSGFLARLRRK